MIRFEVSCPLALKKGRFVFFLFIAALLLAVFIAPNTLGSQAEHPVLEFDGKWQQGAILRGRVAPPSTYVEFLERQVRVAADGRFVIGLGRDAPSEAVVTTVDPDEQRREHRFAVQQREYPIQRIEGVPQRTVTPDPEQVARSRAEAALAWQARQLDSERTDFAQAFEWPLTGRISGVYGSQRYYNGEPRTPHYGVDIAAPTGTPVRAPAAGVVTLVHPDMFFSGGTLIVDHGHGLSSTFIHLHKILVEEGQRVEQGDVIAQVGATGRATGPHLDWRMNWFDQRVDPTLLVAPMPSRETTRADD
jgi:murein DD-endopeptidase MepM/ murein hydrolase activator NlpD